jgi:RNA polymerase sigma factor FliA
LPEILFTMSDSKTDIKSLEITSETTTRGADIAKFMPLVEMIARKEFGSKRYQNIFSFDELVNTGLIAVHNLIEQAKTKVDTKYNSSYIAQSVKWAITDELRKRQSWYGVKRTAPSVEEADANKPKREFDETETTEIKTLDDARKAVFEVIMSVESMEEDLGFSPAADSQDHLDRLELLAIKQSLMKSISKLPDNLKQVINMRFYENYSGNEVAEKLGVTPSRISHMIKEAVKKLKVSMIAEGYND